MDGSGLPPQQHLKNEGKEVLGRHPHSRPDSLLITVPIRHHDGGSTSVPRSVLSTMATVF